MNFRHDCNDTGFLLPSCLPLCRRLAPPLLRLFAREWRGLSRIYLLCVSCCRSVSAASEERRPDGILILWRFCRSRSPLRLDRADPCESHLLCARERVGSMRASVHACAPSFTFVQKGTWTWIMDPGVKFISWHQSDSTINKYHRYYYNYNNYYYYYCCWQQQLSSVVTTC